LRKLASTLAEKEAKMVEFWSRRRRKGERGRGSSGEDDLGVAGTCGFLRRAVSASEFLGSPPPPPIRFP
jgi:hypothetical protein